MQSFFAYVAIALLATSASARTLTQSTYTDADIYNFALNLEYLEVRFNLSTALQLLPVIESSVEIAVILLLCGGDSTELSSCSSRTCTANSLYLLQPAG